MLRAVIGSLPEEKLNIYSREIRSLIKDGRGSKVLCIVPDQFSFVFDKMLYNELGAADFNQVKIVSFKKLSDELISSIGTDKGILIRPEERFAVIYLALKRVRAEKKLKALARAAEKPAFIGEVSALIDSLIRTGMTAQALKDCAEIMEGSVAQKLYDVAEIYEAYLNCLSERGLRDESSLISLGASLAEKSGFFKDMDVYVDRFDSFSADELALLSQAVKSARMVTVSVTLPVSYKPSTVSPYAVTQSTQNSLIDLAKTYSTRITYLNCNAPDARPKGLKELCELFAGVKRSADLSDGSVELISAPTVYDEADFVAAKTRELVFSGKYTYNDIAVITRDISACQNALESAFERYDIPYFIDSKSRASDMSVIIFAIAAIEAATSRKPNTDRLLKLVRSPFSGFSEEEISLVEDYCVRWNVDGEMWLSGFTAGDPEQTQEINRIRAKILDPILKLKEDCRSADAKGVCLAFNRYIEESGLGETAGKILQECTDPDEKLEAARLFKQLWNALMNAVAAVYQTVGEEKLTLKEFGELIKLMSDQTGISNPPQKLSSVTVYDAARSVIASPKVAFVMGVNDGKFPMDTKKTGIFSGRDTAALESKGLKFEINELERLNAERFDCFRALTCTGEKLYISYSESDTSGKTLRPSFYVNRLISASYIKAVKAERFSEEMYSSTPQAAYYRLAVRGGGSMAQLSAIRSALDSLPEYRKKLDRASSSASGAVRHLSPSVASRLFAPHDINITASRIDVYNKCPFEYFMKYGLDIQSITPMAIDPANRGSIMHFVFENVLEYYGEGFESVSDEELTAAISQLLDKYESEILGGDFGKSAKFKADYRRLAGACFEILVNIREEYKVSKFRPVRFEYSLTKENGQSVLSIPINSRLKINIRGIVDRVDLCRAEDGKAYIRIVDYKTGAKELRFEDLYNGLNLQMLLYMVALTEGKDPDFADCLPAGILYMKAGFLECKEEAAGDYSPVDEAAKERFKRSASQLKRSGLLIEDDSSIEAMDSDFSGLYAPVFRNKDGSYSKRSSVISEKSFKLLEEFAIKKVREFGAGLLSGSIAPVPCGNDQKHLPCTYCDYTSVCDRRKYMYKLITASDGEKLLSEISEMEGEE